MADIIRQDIIQVEFDIDDSPLQKASKMVDGLSDDVKGNLGKNTFSGFNNSAEKATGSVAELEKTTKAATKGIKQLAKTSLTNLAKGAKSVATGLGNIAKKAGTKFKEIAKTSFDKLKTNLNKVKTKLSEIANKTSGKVLTGLKKIAGITFKGLVAGLGGAAVAIGKFASMASDLEETKNKIDVAFGSGKGEFDGSAKDVMKWSKNSTTAMGLAQQTALDTAALFGDMGTSMGLPKDKAAEMSMALTQQAADIASFKNLSIDEATTALNGIFTGETESLKRLGVVMTQENLEKYAGKSLKNMTEAEKVMLRYNYVMEKTKNATGDYARTGGGFANQLRTLTENFKQLGTILGELPMKKLASGMKIVNDGLAKIQGILEDGFQKGDTEKIMDIVNGLIDKGINAIADGLPKVLPVVVETLSTVVNGLVKAIPKVAPVLAKGVVDLMMGLGKVIIDNRHELVNAALEVVKAVGNAIYEGFTGKELAGGKNVSAKGILLGAGGLFGALVAVKGLPALISKLPLFSKLFGKKSKGGKKNSLLSKLGKEFEKLGKSKSGKIAKGVANLSIIVGGITLLTAACVTIMALVNKVSTPKEMLMSVGIIGVVGLVGTALAKLSQMIGNIKVSTVAKGLANIAIIVGGTALLTVLLDLLKYAKMDYRTLLKSVVVMGVVGVVGGALAGIAGLVGLIPFPVVLMGLAGIATALAGFTLIVEAFGLLSKIPGFNYFLDKGGEVLVKITSILGEMVGSLVGGVVEGFSTALPTLGENLGKFGENIKPLFTSMQGVDIGGVASFFGALVGLLGIATGNEIVQGIKSFFGGDDESALSKLGKDLGSFAENSKGFFTAIATFPEDGFKKATQMFECLGGLKGLPTEGGIKSWFSGNINYESLANGLGYLSGEKVTKFFNTVSTLKAEGFDIATKMFECLGGMKSLPKEGGVKGWFGGDVNYQNIASGLGALSGEGVTKFFTMAESLKQTGFDNATKLFECLAGMGNLTSGEGFWERLKDGLFGGDDDKTQLSILAEGLGDFTDKASGFFTMVNELNLTNLNGMWDSLSNAETLTTDISKKIGDTIDDIVTKISDLPNKMGEAIKNGGESLSSALVEIWKDAVEATTKPVNKLISGANWILKEFGSKKVVAEWQPYARGTTGHKGGNALVNDGRGAELVQMPNGRMFIPNGRNIFLPNAPKGMKVLSAENTARLFGRGSPTFNYAEGTGKIDIWDYIDNAKGLVDSVSSKYVNYKGMSTFAKSIGEGMVSTISGEMVAWSKKLFEENGGLGLADYVASKGVGQWRSTVIRALKMEGQYSASNVARTLYQMQTESGGNPRAINLWDSNAKKGIPSKGLMQVIDPTFKAYARSGYDKNIYDPLSNILASVRYAVSRYGSLSKAYRGVGYSKGVGTITMPTQPNAVNLSYEPESSYTGGKAEVTEYNTYAPVFNFTISGTGDDRATARKVKKLVKQAMEEVFESMSRRSPKLQES